MKSVFGLLVVFVLAGCTQVLNQHSDISDVDTVGTSDSAAQVQLLLDELFEEQLAMSPEWLTSLGRDERKSEWDDNSPEAQDRWIGLLENQLERLETIDADELDATTALNLTLLKSQLSTDIENDRWRYHDYPVNQMFGVHSSIPSLLIASHRVANEADANAYLKRIKTVGTKIDQLLVGLEIRRELGVVAPEFVFDQVISDSQNLISGLPFDQTEADSPLLADFKTKVAELDASGELIGLMEQALVEDFQPAYQRMIAYLEELRQSATGNHGVWALPEGEDYYRARLKAMTTTDMSPEEIHQMGLDGVASIHAEMEGLMRVVGFKGTLAEFFVYMREDPQFYFPNTEEGRDAYLAKTRDLIASIETKLPELFYTLPRAQVEVRRVEAYREQSAGKAFYQRPSEDGTRDGIYYVNLFDMNDMPIPQMEALAYHEAAPGHHMQIAINQEIDGMPKFRRYSYRYTAYVEGWGLYSEYVPKEMGLYADPYSDFGRLSMALWRAARLVVDTGLHAKQWSREEAIDYLIANTPNSARDCRRAIERYLVMPGQATAYYVGMQKILDLRDKARLQMGDRFDLRQFHDLILSGGSLPLDLLEARVDDWIAEAGPTIN